MEFSYTIEKVDNLVQLKMSGALSAERLTTVMKAIAEDPHYRPGMNAVADFRECAGSWDYSEIQRFRDYVVRACGAKPRRWASIVRPGEIEAVGRVLIVISEAVEAHIRMRLFDDVDDARRWVAGAEV